MRQLRSLGAAGSGGNWIINISENRGSVGGFIWSSFVCHKLDFSLFSLSVPLCLALPFRAVAREAGRMRRLATDEGHGEKTAGAREQSPSIERFCDKHDPKPVLRQNQPSNPRITEHCGSHFGAFSPLPYMAGQRYIVPGFNRLAAAALLTGFILTLMVLNYFGARQKTSASSLVVISHHLHAAKERNFHSLRLFLAQVKHLRAKTERFARWLSSCFHLKAHKSVVQETFTVHDACLTVIWDVLLPINCLGNQLFKPQTTEGIAKMMHFQWMSCQKVNTGAGSCRKHFQIV